MKSRAFFRLGAAAVAKSLVGCRLVVGDKKFKIKETEAYLGENDEASHARFGKTDCSQIMYDKPGVLYVYLIYGMHHMLNIVTGEVGDPQAVLIRGAEGIDGPGKLTKKLGITKTQHNGMALGEESGVWIEGRPTNFDANEIQAAPRVGIDYASEEWREKKLRFVLSTNRN